MAKEWAKAFYNSARWMKARNAYIQERTATDGGLCEECHRDVGYIVHHRVPLKPENIMDPRISLGRDNMEYVCKQCHDAFEGHGQGGRGRKRHIRPECMFDADGQPVLPPFEGVPRNGAPDRLPRLT